MDKTVSLAPLPALKMTVRRRRLAAGEYIKHDLSHTHRAFEIHVVLRGDMSFEVENRVYLLSRGCVVTARPYEDHRLFHLSDEECEHFWVNIVTENDEFPPSVPFPKRGVLLLNEAQLTSLTAILEDVLQHGDNPLVSQLAFLQVFRLLNESERQHHSDHAADLPDDVIRALRYMDEHLTDDICAAQLAAACNISVSTLERHFKTALNVSPMVMLRKKRFVASMHRLTAGDSVAEAAIASGFADYSHYVQLFKKQYGITPLQYKKNNLKK